jgi:dolichol-phosphate mannosyltransferase
VGEWVLVVDADTAPQPGMVAGAVEAARRLGLDAVSFAPRIIAPGPGARWLQPSLLTTLVYRFGPPNTSAPAERVMANGQCMLMRRDVLERAGGYGVAADSYCDDIRMARHLAARGARVGFLDGPRLLDVTMYPTARETWRAWPPSLHMRDATRMRWRWLDALVLLLAQALPIPMLLFLALAAGRLDAPRGVVMGLVVVNGALLVVRALLAVATAHSFAVRGISYWLAPLADPFIVPRVIWTMLAPPREWRGAPVQAAVP